jgi:hypothetical protein
MEVKIGCFTETIECPWTVPVAVMAIRPRVGGPGIARVSGIDRGDPAFRPNPSAVQPASAVLTAVPAPAARPSRLRHVV